MARKSTEKESPKEAKMVGKTDIGANQGKTGTAKAKASGKPNSKNGGSAAGSTKNPKKRLPGALPAQSRMIKTPSIKKQYMH